MEKTWNRWHAEGWVLAVVRTADGAFSFSATRNDQPVAANVPATSVIDAQHRAEDLVRSSGHRCTGPCSYWVADPPDGD